MILYQPQQGLSKFQYSSGQMKVHLFSYLTIWVNDGETLELMKDPYFDDENPEIFLDFEVKRQHPDLVRHAENKIVNIDLIYKVDLPQNITDNYERQSYLRENHIKPHLHSYDKPGDNIYFHEYRITARVFDGTTMKGTETNLISQGEDIDIH